MSALNWLDPLQSVDPDPATGFTGITAQPLRAEPSSRTSYRVYLHPDDTYVAVVTITAASGPMTTTYQLKQSASAEEAKALAQADWDSGKRP